MRREPEGGKYATRLGWLRSIPFRTVVTTNFDDELAGIVPDAGRIVTSLRTGRPVWTRIDQESHIELESVVKLHGQIGAADNDAVLSRRAYRARVHGRSGYSRLVSAAFAMNDVLFLGTSFTDAYLNELRSEVLSWFEEAGAGIGSQDCLACRMPVRWWAVLPDARPELVRSMARHDGIEVISYDSSVGEDHADFDAILQRMSQQASLSGLLGDRIRAAAKARRRPATVWWCDDVMSGNERGIELLRKGLGENGVELFQSPDEVERALDRQSPPMLIITKFKGADAAFARPVIDVARKVQTPVVVFGGAHGAEERRWWARSYGAVDYTHDWRDLFRVIAELFEREPDRQRRLFGG